MSKPEQAELREFVRHIIISTEQDGVGIALGRRSTDGTLYKSRIDEHTDRVVQLFEQELLKARMDEVNNIVRDEYFHPSGRHIGAVKYHVLRYKELSQNKPIGGSDE
jgi:hypothetical protein